MGRSNDTVIRHDHSDDSTHYFHRDPSVTRGPQLKIFRVEFPSGQIEEWDEISGLLQIVWFPGEIAYYYKHAPDGTFRVFALVEIEENKEVLEVDE